MSLVQFVEFLRFEFFQSGNAMSFSELLDLQQLLLITSFDNLQIPLILIQILSETSLPGLVSTHSVETTVLHARIELLLHKVIEIVKSTLTLIFLGQDPVHHLRVTDSVSGQLEKSVLMSFT